MSRLRWTASRAPGTIAPDEIHVWSWDLEPATLVDLAAHIEILDVQERQRLQRFHFAPDRARYAVAHANVRTILGSYLHQPAASVRFRANGFGKPELDLSDPSSLHFNLSHSRSIALLAVSNGLPVGVDVEEVRPIEREVAESSFSANERWQLNKLDGDAWLTGFYRCWTRKEAIVKAEGVGLSHPLDSFDVSLSPAAELLGTRKPFSYTWRLHDLSPSEGTIGAVATAQSDARLMCFSFVNDAVS